MKKLILMAVWAFCSFTAFSQKADTISKASVPGHSHTIEYMVKCDNIYLSSLYMTKAGRNLVGGGVFLGLSMVSALVPNFIPAENRTNSLYLTCGVVSGIFLIGSVIEFCVAGKQLNKAGIILRSGKRYTIVTNGAGYVISVELDPTQPVAIPLNTPYIITPSIKIM